MNQYRDLSSGIYIWKNKITNQVLIGQTVDFNHRKRTYLSKLRNNKWPNKHFQSSWNKYSEKVFEFIVLEFIDDLSFLTSYEQSYLDYYRTLSGGVFNQIGPADSPMLGFNHSEETKLKISLASKNQSFESREKTAFYHRGQSLTQDHKVKISKALLGFKNTDLTREKISKAMKGKPWSLSRKQAQERRCKNAV